ncbi:unnamed protein product [Protopolystoma xenopodis]|uniref:Kinesin motor domain-containing protein n=1 Tax=Protopolystoma xenopodis TaxID=117903 RepID=A0A448WI93_9PLAT|nr:unnamed protein product [Protopolystoma xenopodis]
MNKADGKHPINVEGLDHPDDCARLISSLTREVEKLQSTKMENLAAIANTAIPTEKQDEFSPQKDENDIPLPKEDMLVLEETNRQLTKKLEEKNAEIKELKDQIKMFKEKEEANKINPATEFELRKQIASLTETNEKLTENYQSEVVLRKKYYNMMEDMKGKIRVYCRVRPISSSEIEKNCRIAVSFPDIYTLQIDSGKAIKEYQFDRVFDQSSSQSDVFEDTAMLIQSAVDGFNVCVFAYGQTGSGKTHTLIGSESNPGLAPRCFSQLFTVINDKAFL